MNALLAILAASAATGPQAPALLPRGTGTLDSGETTPGDIGVGRVLLGGRSPFEPDLGGEWYGGFCGMAGVAQDLSLAVGVPDARRLALDGSGERVDPGPAVLAIRYAPSRVPDLAVGFAASRPVTPRSSYVGAWQGLFAYGRTFGLLRAFGNIGFVLPEEGAFGGWVGAGARSRSFGPVALGASAWVATDWTAQGTLELAFLPRAGIEVAALGGPRWATDGTPRAELELRLSMMIDPREHDRPGDRDVDGVTDDLDACPTVAGSGTRGCPPLAEEGACACVLDDLDRAEVEAMLDLLRHPVEGKVFVVRVWASSSLSEGNGWKVSREEATAVEEAFRFAGVSMQDVRVVAMGAATEVEDPRLTYDLMTPTEADALIRQTDAISPRRNRGRP